MDDAMMRANAAACKGAEAFSASDEDELAGLRAVQARVDVRRWENRREWGTDSPATEAAYHEAIRYMASPEGQHQAELHRLRTAASKAAVTADASPIARGPWAAAAVPNGSLAWSVTRFALASIVPQFSQCESVAEQMFLLGMVVPSSQRRVVLAPPALPLVIAADGRCLELDAQSPAAGRRLDFVLRGSSGRRVAIEVDGFAYHERTQEQAEADRSRDRELLAIGIVTLRFMAKAVFADPTKCADEAFAIALGECSAGGLEAAMKARVAA